jgi:hypothetical protein
MALPLTIGALFLGAETPALAQSVGFSVGFSTQVTRGTSISNEMDVRSQRGFYLEGENVSPVPGETNPLTGDLLFQIRDLDQPFSIMQLDLTGQTIRTVGTQSSSISAGGSTTLSVFANF